MTNFVVVVGWFHRKYKGRLFPVLDSSWSLGMGDVKERGLGSEDVMERAVLFKKLIIPQGAILLWSWWAHKIMNT